MSFRYQGPALWEEKEKEKETSFCKIYKKKYKFTKKIIDLSQAIMADERLVFDSICFFNDINALTPHPPAPRYFKLG